MHNDTTRQYPNSGRPGTLWVLLSFFPGRQESLVGYLVINQGLLMIGLNMDSVDWTKAYHACFFICVMLGIIHIPSTLHVLDVFLSVPGTSFLTRFILMMLLFPSSSSSTLCTEEVLTFLNTRMLFWACSTSRPEGYRGTHPSTLALRLHYLDLLELEIHSTKRNWPYYVTRCCYCKRGRVLSQSDLVK